MIKLTNIPKILVLVDGDYCWKTLDQIREGDNLAEAIFTLTYILFVEKPKKISIKLLFSLFFLNPASVFIAKPVHAISFNKIQTKAFARETEIEGNNTTEYRQLYKVFNIKKPKLKKPRSLVGCFRSLTTDKINDKSFLNLFVLNLKNSSQKELVKNHRFNINLGVKVKEEYMVLKNSIFMPNSEVHRLTYENNLNSKYFAEPDFKEKILESVILRAGYFRIGSFEAFQNLLNFVQSDKEIGLIFNFLISLTNIKEDLEKLKVTQNETVQNFHEKKIFQKVSEILIENKIKILFSVTFAIAIIYRKSLINFLLNKNNPMASTLEPVMEILVKYEEYLSDSFKTLKFQGSIKFIKILEIFFNQKKYETEDLLTIIPPVNKITSLEKLKINKTPQQLCEDKYPVIFDKIIKCHPEYEQRQEAMRQFEIRQELKEALKREPSSLKFDSAEEIHFASLPNQEQKDYELQDVDYIDLDKQ
jgi:hypothetical protein